MEQKIAVAKVSVSTLCKYLAQERRAKPLLHIMENNTVCLCNLCAILFLPKLVGIYLLCVCVSFSLLVLERTIKESAPDFR